MEVVTNFHTFIIEEEWLCVELFMDLPMAEKIALAIHIGHDNEMVIIKWRC